ncbi:MAG TPA: hypothetical protein VGA78_15695 [Gemmatimonadales bacterium]
MRHAPRWALGVLMALVMACQERAQEPVPPPPAVSPTSSLARSDQLILVTAKVALPPGDVQPGDLPEPASPEAGLLVKYCSQCHDFPTPTMHAAVDWPQIVRRMWLRMDRLPDTLQIQIPELGERIALVNYLVANALRVSGAVLPPGPGRQEFSTICSRCHALPDPRAHTAPDWPQVFMRMERNMERMKVRAPGPEESRQIVTYLQANGARP